MKYLLSTLLFLSLFTQFAAAQSKKETEKFIVEKCRWTSGEKAWEVAFDGPDASRRLICKSLEWSSHGKPHDPNFFIQGVLIRDLNPNRLKVQNNGGVITTYILSAYTTSKNRAMCSFDLDAPKDAMKKFSTPEEHAAALRQGISRNDDVYTVFSSERTAKQVAKALTHLIKLYGGKEELFEP